jgi:hypothetical protein
LPVVVLTHSEFGPSFLVDHLLSCVLSTPVVYILRAPN